MLKHFTVVFPIIFLITVHVYAAKTPEIPRGFQLIEKDIGEGKYSRVHLLERISDKKQFAWKIARTVTVEQDYWQFRKVANLHQAWVKLGLTSLDLFYLEDPSQKGSFYILHEMAGKETLVDIYKKYPNFIADFHNPYTQALDIFFATMTLQNVYIRDLNPGNIVWDGQRWQLIDSQSIRLATDPIDAWSHVYNRLVNEKGFKKERLVSYQGWDPSGVKTYFEHLKNDVIPVLNQNFTLDPALPKYIERIKKYTLNEGKKVLLPEVKKKSKCFFIF